MYICKELEEKDNNNLENKEKSNSLHLCLNGIPESIDNLSNNLQSIHKKQEEHKLKYFYYWRTCDILSEYAIIEKEIKRLNKRFNLLVKLNKK